MFEFKQARKSFLLLPCCVLLVTATAVMTLGQNPGDKVEYKAQNWPEKWEVGTFVKVLPGGTQVLIREKPNEFYPEGFERAYALNDMRPVANKPPVADQPKAPENPPKLPQDPPHEDEPNPKMQPGRGGGAQMSQQDVLSFLRDRLGDSDPFRNPKREQVLQELREEALRRGLNFRYTAIGDFSNQLGKFGALSNVTAALADNFGPPAKLNELYGMWRLAKVGAGWNPRFANAGSLTINANGSYVWNSPSGVLRGKWRKATAEEMAKSDKGGEGVVLLNAKSNLDWLVFKRNEGGPQGEGIKITDLVTRNMRERGTR